MSIDYSKIPAHMREGTRLYIEEGIEPGGFLTAVLANDLTGAVGRADETNKRYIQQWAEFMMCEMPGNLWGNYDVVRNHCQEMSMTRALRYKNEFVSNT